MLTHRNHMHVLQKYVDSLVVKNIHQKGMCYNKIGLCAQTIDIILASIVKTIGSAIAIWQSSYLVVREHDSNTYLDPSPIYSWAWLGVHHK